jgi:GNAT superfamily N-acetyltransferase
MRVVELTCAQTHPLRRLVLRDDDPARSVVFDGDDEPGTFHLGVVDDSSGEIVATSTWLQRPTEHAPGSPAVQLRGMATSPARQGSGVGGLLFDAAVELCSDRGYVVLWANARDSALAFYERQGCTAVGDGFVDATTGLPHHVVVRRLFS